VIHAGTQQWREAKRRTVGASEVAALFGVHPFVSYYELWHLKAGLIEEQDIDPELEQKGKFLEDAVANWAAWREGYTIARHQGFVTHPRVSGWSATPDYRCLSNWREGEGRMEVKVTGFVDYDECPAHYGVQLQSQLACDGLDWGVVACLSASPRMRILTWEYDRNDIVIDRIESAIVEFWSSIERGEPPAPNYHVDRDVIYQLFAQHEKGIVKDFEGDNRAVELCAQLIDARRREHEAREEKDAAQAELIHKMGSAMIGLAGPYRIRSVAISASPDRIITAADLGSVIPGRAGSRHLRIKEEEL
jgi:predicted phage-related endonuclease